LQKPLCRLSAIGVTRLIRKTPDVVGWITEMQN
jgi:hypothetical protein